MNEPTWQQLAAVTDDLRDAQVNLTLMTTGVLLFCDWCGGELTEDDIASCLHMQGGVLKDLTCTECLEALQ